MRHLQRAASTAAAGRSGREPLTFNPVDARLGTPILAVALDLGASCARGRDA
jgi:hypothetical protein